MKKFLSMTPVMAVLLVLALGGPWALHWPFGKAS